MHGVGEGLAIGPTLAVPSGFASLPLSHRRELALPRARNDRRCRIRARKGEEDAAFNVNEPALRARLYLAVVVVSSSISRSSLAMARGKSAAQLERVAAVAVGTELLLKGPPPLMSARARCTKTLKGGPCALQPQGCCCSFDAAMNEKFAKRWKFILFLSVMWGCEFRT